MIRKRYPPPSPSDQEGRQAGADFLGGPSNSTFSKYTGTVPVREVRSADPEFLADLKGGAKLYLGPTYEECTYKILLMLVRRACPNTPFSPAQLDVQVVGMAVALHWRRYVQDVLGDYTPIIVEPTPDSLMVVVSRNRNGAIERLVLPSLLCFPSFFIEQRVRS